MHRFFSSRKFISSGSSGFLNTGGALAKLLFRKPVSASTNVTSRIFLETSMADHQNEYSALVKKVNKHLDYAKEPLSLHSAQVVAELGNEVESGKITAKEAHSIESVHWLTKSPENGGARLIGFLTNAVSSIENDNEEADRWAKQAES